MALVVGPAGGALSVATEVLLFDIAKLGGLPRSAEHAAASLLACPTALLGHLLVTGPALKTLRLAPGLQVGILAGYEGFFGELPPDSRVALVNYAQLPASLVLEHEVLQAA